MARRRRDSDELLTENLPHVRVTKKEKDEIYQAAEMRDMTVTDYLRILIFRRLPRNKIKKLQLVDHKVLAELARQGANLRNLFNEYSRTGHFDRKRSAEILDEIDRAVRYVAEVHRRYLEQMDRAIQDDRQSDTKA